VKPSFTILSRCSLQSDLQMVDNSDEHRGGIHCKAVFAALLHICVNEIDVLEETLRRMVFNTAQRNTV